MFERIRNGGLAALMAVLLIGLLAPVASACEESPPPAGLMWNRTGLPAVFPLQVKTAPGQDHMVTLIDADTGAEALAAYIKGGAFFKILVPPGTYRVRFATGEFWQGEQDLFGPGEKTQGFEMPEPLTFETRGLGVKAGHVVNLLARGPGRLAAVTLKDQLICQSFRPQFPAPDTTVPQPPVPRYSERSERLRDTRPGDGPRYTAPSRLDVRSRFCG